MSAIILAFPGRRKPISRDTAALDALGHAGAASDTVALDDLGHAGDLAASAGSELACAEENIIHGASLLGQQPAIHRALHFTLRLALALVNLRGNPERDHALTGEIRRWLEAHIHG